MAKITKRAVEAALPQDDDVFLWDQELRGFGVRVKPSGVRSYVIQYRNGHGRSRRLTIGTHGRLTAEEARYEARQLLSKVARGADPAGEKKSLREAPTFADFAKRYMSEHASGRKKVGTLVTDQINLRCHILPALGKLPLTSIQRTDIARMMQSMRHTPGAANRTLQLLSSMLNVAEKWGLRPDHSNPCRHIDRYKSGKRERFLSAEELSRLGNVLREAEEHALEGRSAIAAIRLLILTGCRRGEILTLRWEEVDLANSCLRLSDSKTGPRMVHLNEAAKAVLVSMMSVPGNPFVIAGARAGSHLINLKKPWQRIRRAAGLPDVRLHDLRHSFASVAIGLGEPLAIIGKLLGHTQTATTERYAHLAADPVRAANERIGHTIAGLMTQTLRPVS